MLSRSATLEEVKVCLKRQVKYLFDCQLARFCFYQRDHYVVFTLALADSLLESGDKTLLWEHERLLTVQDVPSIFDDQALINNSLRGLRLPLRSQPTRVWGWTVGFSSDSGMIASVFTDNDQQFQASDVPVLRIALENLYAKILSIRLIDELASSKQEVEEALLALQEKNDVITRLVATQEAIIQSRTQELEVKNAKLIQLSRQHAHIIREPLSRILGLAYLIDMLPPEEVIRDIIPVMVTTSQDLDVALQQVIQDIDTELTPLP